MYGELSRACVDGADAFITPMEQVFVGDRAGRPGTQVMESTGLQPVTDTRNQRRQQNEYVYRDDKTKDEAGRCAAMGAVDSMEVEL